MKTIAIKTISRNHIALSLAAIFALSACGDSSNNSTMEIPLPDVSFPVPKVDKNRPKEGRQALYNVPWTTADGPKRKGNIFGKSYFMVTENTLSKTTMCSQIVVITGERKWITPTAKVDIAFDQDNFTTLNKEPVVVKEKLDGKSCDSALPATTTYKYALKADGEKLELTTTGEDGKPQTEELIIFRN